jgi:hypothetical protein
MIESPYLKHDNRLGDVIGAIQALASYKWHGISMDEWKKHISPKPSAGEWEDVFSEHSEFFYFHNQEVALVWRRGFEARFDVDLMKELSGEEFLSLSDSERKKRRLSRGPLDSTQIGLLLTTATQLHASALAHSSEKRWWIPLLAAVSAFVGSLIGSYVTFITGWTS